MSIPPKSTLDAAGRAELRRVLETQRHALRGQIATHQEGRSRTEHAQDLLERDYDDAPQRAADREVDLAITDLDVQVLGAVDRALDRLDDPDFGLCADCGAEIPFARLQVAPYAERCVACESEIEQLHRKV